MIVKSRPGSVTNTVKASCQPDPAGPCAAEASASTKLLPPFAPPTPPGPKPKPTPPAATPPSKPAPTPPSKPKPTPPNKPAPNNPSKPPAGNSAAACQSVSVRPSSLSGDGKPQTLTVSVTRDGDPVANAAIVLEGPRIARVVHAGANGTVAITLVPRRAGVLTVSIRGGARAGRNSRHRQPPKPPVTG